MDIERDVVVEQGSGASNPITGEGRSEAKAPVATVDNAEVKDTEIKAEEVKTDEEASKPEPIPKGVQRRIDRAVREKYEAQARAKLLEERVAAMESRHQASPQPSPEKSEPTIADFENFDDYVSAKARYLAKREIESTLTEREQRQEAERRTAEEQKIAESWGKKVEQATAEMPDFEEVIASSDLPMTPVMRQAIMESDIGPKLAYYLATHPDEASRLAQMSNTGAVRTLGRIEERLSSQKPTVAVTKAPAPVTPVGSRATVHKDPGKMSDAEYAKWRKSA